jgi:hypothetical protein
LETGRWQNLSQERRGELDTYAEFVTRQFHQIKTWEEQASIPKRMF